MYHYIKFSLTLLIFPIVTYASIFSMQSACETMKVDDSFQTALYEKLSTKLNSIPIFKEFYEKDTIDYEQHGNLKNPAQYKDISLVSLQEFETSLDSFFQIMTTRLKQKENWLGQSSHLEKLTNGENTQFFPYAEKELSKAKSIVVAKGDLHGDIYSLDAFIKQLKEWGYTQEGAPLKISDSRVKILFLGDYTDRGLWGVEVITLIALLKVNNPDQVVLVRGNHEDVDMTSKFGFENEFTNKFSMHTSADRMRVLKKVAKFFELLPVVYYLGCGNEKVTHYVQCCHGGIEIGYNPKQFLASDKKYHWIESFQRQTECVHLPNIAILDGKQMLDLRTYCKDFIAKSPMNPYSVGFMWTDFVVDPEGSCRVTPRALECNKELAHAVLQAASTQTCILTAIIRAHQHRTNDNEPIMKLLLAQKGCAQLWKDSNMRPIKLEPGTVITLLLSPDSLMGMPTKIFRGFEYDTSLIIETAEEFPWDMKVINNDVYKKRL